MYFGSWTTLSALGLDANWNIKATVEDAAATCFPPTAINISNITYNSADIAWVSTSTAWNLKISSTVIDPTTGTGDIFDGAATTASYNATGLSELTDYYVYVQTDCGSSTTSNWLASGFTTVKDCAGITAPWTDDMSSGIDCWELYDEDGDGNNWLNTEVITGDPSLNSFSWDAVAGPLNPDNWAVTNKINIGSLSTPFLSWTAVAFDPDWVSEHYSVYISTTGNTPADFGTTAVFSETIASANQLSRSVSLASYSGDIWVAFRHHGVSDVFGFGIDNVKVDNTTSINSNAVGTVDFTIYPNPANEKVTIANAEGQQVIILDITGKVVLTIEAATKLQVVNTSDFAAGTYIVRVNASVSKFNVVR